ncbi:hypothetical protein SAMN05518865_11564 [Duganella sp. CF458]|uniref:hypothetical protein n=1 Tax=Duganella sp. CF458 TaxID=1884368 RepID=UPI0008DFA2C1|nr:hypothetical protein [Duganella sp. CF458]SFG64302.1 hypothetical protein SAMN05518865_11564 [Duganella sp. CF458]
MSSDSDENGGTARQRIEQFIFIRELNEVFLLLDHISGRWDKSLHKLDNKDDGEPHIDELCAIGLTPPENDQQRVAQAVKVLCAKDRLNAAARPATGLTIAFTLLVVGEDNRRDWRNWLRDRMFGKGSSGTGSENSAQWDKPTRLTLARNAFPGLVRVASRFNLRMKLVVYLLLVGLVLTCLMSWHVAGGNAILQHLDAVQAAQAALSKEIGEAELKHAASGTAPPMQFCTESDMAGLPHDRSMVEYQLCTRRQHLAQQAAAIGMNLRDWLLPWQACYDTLARPFGRMPPGGALQAIAAPTEKEGRLQRALEEQARVVTLVVGTAVLPLCYGVLGAGAAVVRSLWAKMRDSLLSPREFTLALMQLALGATIGACIALFVNPSSQSTGCESGLLGNQALGMSAISFIAGFGVEGVFVALEGLVRRIFRIDDPVRRPDD